MSAVAVSRHHQKVLQSIPADLAGRVRSMIRDGYGGSGIFHETRATRSQINALFAEWNASRGVAP